MKLRSYLRGIGIGVLVTAAVFIVSGYGQTTTTMTDEQVIARAKELGMIEDVVLSVAGNDSEETGDLNYLPTEQVDVADAQPDEGDILEIETEPTEAVEEAVPTVEAEQAPEPTKEVKAEPTPEPTKEVKAEPTPEPTKEVKAEPTPEPTKEVKAEPTPEPTKETKPAQDSKEVIIVVNAGDGSDRVARKLYEAGVVADAAEFDRYLMANGYDRRITIGNHKIAITASNEEIAKNLVSSTK